MKHAELTLLILGLNSMIDSGKFDDISLEEVRRHIDDGSILDFIRERAGHALGLSFLESSYRAPFVAEYVNYLQAILDAYGGDEGKRWGIKNKGLCLLLAWTNEILQQGTGWKAEENIARRV